MAYKIMKLSIITVCFNAENSIRNTLKSVANSIIENKLLLDVEYLIVDGNSTDNTLQIIKEFCNNHSFSSYISEQDHGIYDAYNKGWRMSSGKFAWFVNADDVIKVNALKFISESISNNSNADIHCFSLNRVDPFTKKESLQLRDLQNPVKILSPVCHTPSIIWSIKSLNAIGGFDTSLQICSDFLALQILLKNKYNFVASSDTIIDMYLGGVSSQYKFEIRKAKEQIFVINKICNNTSIKIKAVLNIIFKLLRNTLINPIWRVLKK